MRTSHPKSTAAAKLALLASFLVAGYFLAFDAGNYLVSVTTAVYGRFWPMRSWLFLHIATGGLALIAGGIQLCLAFLRRPAISHRWIGRVYVAAVLTSCVSSLVVLRNGSVLGSPWVVLLVLLSSGAMLFTALGLLAARRRRWKHHATWITRSYTTMMVFAWFRLAWELPLLTATPAGDRAAMILGGTMLVTLVGTELAVRRVRSRIERPAIANG